MCLVPIPEPDGENPGDFPSSYTQPTCFRTKKGENEITKPSYIFIRFVES